MLSEPEGIRDGGAVRSCAIADVTAHSLQEMFAVSLLAFWALAKRLRLTVMEQAGLLAISESSCQRWRRRTPPVNVIVLDRLQLVLQSYESLSALAPVSEQKKGRLLRAPGSAESPDDPELSLLVALSVPSILERIAYIGLSGLSVPRGGARS